MTNKEEEEIAHAKVRSTRAYNRNYYHRNKTELPCEICSKIFVCESSLRRHQKRALKCSLIRAKADLQKEREAKAEKENQ
jgi:hypothetical protein